MLKLFRSMLVATFLVSTQTVVQSFAQGAFEGAPEGFILPPLDPTGSELIPMRLSEGVYGLISNKPPVDNVGFIVGKKGVLVIDSHINGEMAGKIMDAVREVTDLPILYLVNTNYHGDHTFGNSFFPAETKIIAHHKTAVRMEDFETEKKLITAAIGGKSELLEGVTLRLPDITFEDNMIVDLGNKIVELHHFGAANTEGDVVVYSPDARTAWTGNFVVGAQFIPPIFEPATLSHFEATAEMARTLDIKTIIPGHGRVTSVKMLGRYADYLNEIVAQVRDQIANGATDGYAVANSLDLSERWYPVKGSPEAALLPFIKGLHKMNVLRTFEDITNKGPRS